MPPTAGRTPCRSSDSAGTAAHPVAPPPRTAPTARSAAGSDVPAWGSWFARCARSRPVPQDQGLDVVGTRHRVRAHGQLGALALPVPTPAPQLARSLDDLQEELAHRRPRMAEEA